MRKDKGVITVFLAFVFSVMITFLCATVDVTRINSAKNQLIIATDAAITSVLSGFDESLYNSYGIMAFNKESVNEGDVERIVKSNLTDSNLFKIEASDISVEAGGSPFTNNEIMKKQMIQSMKYKGTENLALSVFNKLKDLFGMKQVVEDNEYIKELEESKEKQQLDYMITVVEQAKMDAFKAIIELAKNNTFDELIGFNMGYVNNKVSKNDLKGTVVGKKALNYALEATKNEKYSNTSYLHNIYSYQYSKMILKMYYEYSLKVHSNPVNIVNPENIKTPKPDLINAVIKALDRKFDSSIKNNASNLNKELSKLQKYNEKKFWIFKDKDKPYGIEEAINILVELTDNNQYYINLIEKYNNVKSSDVKKSSEETVKQYKELLNKDKLEGYETQLKAINNHINKMKLNINDVVKMGELLVGEGIKWAKDPANTTSDVFKMIDLLIGDTILDDPNSINIDSLVKTISSNIGLMGKKSIEDILNKQMYQVETLKGLEVTSNMDVKSEAEDVDKFKNFFKAFKDIAEDNGKDNSITEALKKYEMSSDKIYKTGLPSNSSEENTSIADELGSVDVKDIESLDNFGSLLKLADGTVGKFLDNAYLVEYIMTNFKDIIGGEYPSRIPSVTQNQTILNFEIEAIIAGRDFWSGSYNDEHSRDAMVTDLLLYRSAINMMSLCNKAKQPDLNRFISTAANTISIATQKTIPTPVIKYAIITGWSALEARYDVIDLFNGKETPLEKVDDDWITDFGVGSSKLGSLKENDLNGLSTQISSIGSSKSDLKNHTYEHKSPGAYNKQDKPISLDYIDFVRLKLLVMDKDKLIDRCQDLIVKNKNITNYESYSTDLKVNVNESNVNFIFNTPTFNGGKKNNKFDSFSFKRSYN